MLVRDIMSSPVVRVSSDTTLRDAVEAMLRHRIGCVLVVDHQIQGILTNSDVLRATYHARAPLRNIPVTDAMTDTVITTTGSATVETALRAMVEHNIKKLPVVDAAEIVGIVTITDIGRELPKRVSEVRHAVEQRDEWTA